MNSRRDFLKISTFGSLAILAETHMAGCMSTRNDIFVSDYLLNTSHHLLQEWCDTLLKYQVTDRSQKGLYGGILCPSCARIHGRCSDAVYPLMYLAESSGETRYLEAALLLFDWMEENVSLPDGAWINDVNVSGWVGTTVFTAIAFAEALLHHGSILDKVTRHKWMSRLKRAADYVNDRFHIEYSNINYPIAGSYALTVLGDLFNEEKYVRHGKELAHQSLEFFTDKNKLLFGEGEGDRDNKSPKGCYSVDLGYNVEESLPSLVLYGLHTGDRKVLNAVKESLEAHMEFMLPDGGWDNSWGTRSFKWTYWGSRTSDGCQAGYALMADQNPSFYRVALQNTLLLKECTEKGLLHGGPHFLTHDVLPCIHHTFCHAKTLATILDRGLPVEHKNAPEGLLLPREEAYGVKFMEDIQTWLISNENWKGTITGYDMEYSFKNGHPTGGALSMLWHRKIGAVLTSSMNEYSLIEAPNMQRNYDPYSMSLTARLQTTDGKYMSISDLSASIELKENEKGIEFSTTSKLVNKDQRDPSKGAIHCDIGYLFSPEAVEINISHDCSLEGEVRFMLPIVSRSDEGVNILSENHIEIVKKGGILDIQSDKAIKLLPTLEGKNRIFNFVPGMEAIPMALSGNSIRILLSATL